MAQATDDPLNTLTVPATASSWECLRLPGLSIPIGDLAITTIQLQIVVIYFLTQFLHHCIFKHVGLPSVVSQMIAGVILSPSAFYVTKGGLCEQIMNTIFPELSASVWKTLAWLGCSLSAFMITVKIDYGIVFKTGQKSYVLAVLGLLLPFGINMIIAFLTKVDLVNLTGEKEFGDDLLITSSISSMSHFPVIVCLLSDLDLLNSELGRLAMSASLISEMGGVFIYLFGKHISNINLSYFKMVLGPLLLVIVALFILRPIMRKMIEQTPKDRTMKTSFVMLVLFFGVVAGLVTHYTSDQYVLLGFFIVGAVTPAGPPLASAFIDVFDSFVNGILQPLFITSVVLRANLVTIDFSDVTIWQHLAIAVLPNVVKILMCVILAVCTKMSIGDGVVLGLLLGSKGFIDLGIYAASIEAKIISRTTFTLLVFWAILVATIVPLLVKSLYNPSRKYIGYQKRDIMHLKQNNDLRILACIYRTDNAIAITSLLDICNPTKNNAIDAYILHLVKLKGRSQPAFISHDIQKKKSTSHFSHSDDILMAFNKYQSIHDHCYQGGLTTHLFTSVTLLKAMHEDICSLAVNSLTSLIILPFHRKLGIDGSIDCEYNDQRLLNLSVLDHAPCSVVVHINRGLGHTTLSPSLNQAKSEYSEHSASSIETTISVETTELKLEFAIAVVFIGGNDDREAVALAKWMSRGFRVRIHLVRLTVPTDAVEWEEEEEEKEVDLMVIQDIKMGNASSERFAYKEVMVKDGAETAALMKSMANDFDLMIVGRRKGLKCHQIAGLEEWSEVPELGVIGDLLASSDLHCRASILVVQRQKQR